MRHIVQRDSLKTYDYRLNTKNNIQYNKICSRKVPENTTNMLFLENKNCIRYSIRRREIL